MAPASHGRLTSIHINYGLTLSVGNQLKSTEAAILPAAVRRRLAGDTLLGGPQEGHAGHSCEDFPTIPQQWPGGDSPTGYMGTGLGPKLHPTKTEQFHWFRGVHQCACCFGIGVQATHVWLEHQQLTQPPLLIDAPVLPAHRALSLVHLDETNISLSGNCSVRHYYQYTSTRPPRCMGQQRDRSGITRQLGLCPMPFPIRHSESQAG